MFLKCDVFVVQGCDFEFEVCNFSFRCQVVFNCFKDIGDVVFLGVFGVYF